MIARWLDYLNPSDVVSGWTPARAAKLEREMLTRLGYVVEPHYLWSRPARERELRAFVRRSHATRAMAPVVAWRKRA